MLKTLLFTWFFTGLSTIVALWASSIAWQARRSRTVPKRRLEEIEGALAELEARQASTHGMVKKVNSRLAMMQAREKRHGEPDAGSLARGPDESPEEFKARMRTKLVQGELGHGR